MTIIDLLKEQGVRIWTEGKNVRKGCVNIQCCYCDDKSNHLGINKRTLKSDCWRCGEKNIYSILATVTDLSKKQIREEIRKIRSENKGDISYEKESTTKDTASITHLPKEAIDIFPKGHIRYLRKERCLSNNRIKEIISKYKLKAVHTESKYRFRIIIPIYMNHKLVAFTSRAISKKQEPKYLNCTPKDCSLNPKCLIYNYDTIESGGNAIAVEGPTDVWALGDKSFALLGVETTKEQLTMLIKKKIKKLFVFFDNDGPGRRRSYFFARNMSHICRNVTNIKLKRGTKLDPGELTETEVEKIKYDINFYN